LLSQLPGGQTGFLIFVNVFIFFLAFFLDFFEIAFIVIPLLAPVAAKLGIDLVWFGVLICINMQTSFMHPPFGFALFYLRGIAPKEVLTRDIYLGAIPWLGLQLILVAVVIFWPQSVTYFLDRGTGVDPATVRIEVPMPDMPDDDAARALLPTLAGLVAGARADDERHVYAGAVSRLSDALAGGDDGEDDEDEDDEEEEDDR